MTETREFFWTNNAATELAADINSAVTSVVVVDGSAFPVLTTGIFTVALRDDALGKFEIMNVTGRTGNTLTVERGAEGTTAASWDSGYKIRHSLTAAWFQARGFTAPVPTVVHIDSLCTYEYSFALSSPRTFLLPAGAEVGDLLFFAAEVQLGTAFTMPAGWNVLCALGAGTNDFGAVDTAYRANVFAYRFMQLGDTQIDISFVGSSGTGSTIGGCVHAFRGVDPLRPFPQALYNPMEQSTVVGYDHHLPFPYMNNAAIGSKIVNFGVRELFPNVYPVFGVGEVEIVHALDWIDTEDLVAGANSLGLISMIYPGEQDELDNLLTHGYRNIGTGWTINGVVVNDSDGLDPPLTDVETVVGGPARHDITKQVALTAGQTYSWMLYVRPDGVTTESLYITVDDGVTGEYGLTWVRSANNWASNGTIGIANYYDPKWSIFSPGVDPDYDSVICFTFTANITGLHTLCLGGTRTPSSAVSTITSTTRGFNLYMQVLATGEHFSPPTKALRSTGAAVPSARGMYPRIVRPLELGANGGRWQLYGFEIKAAGAIPDFVRLTSGYVNSVLWGDDQLSITSAISPSPSVAYATGCIDPWQHSASGRFYFEMTCHATNWESAAFARTSVGVAVSWARAIPYTTDTGVFVYDGKGAYQYRNDGRTSADEAVTTGLATFTAADIIGVEVDYTTSEVRFYKNGALIRTETITVEDRIGPLRAVVIGSSSYSTTREVTLNFAGPFAYLPVGAVAYDWENS